MEVGHLCWLERRPARQGFDQDILNYQLQLLVENRLVALTTQALGQAARAAQAQDRALRFAVPGSFNGRLFDCRVTVSAGQLRQAGWLYTFEQQLLALCRARCHEHSESLA